MRWLADLSGLNSKLPFMLATPAILQGHLQQDDWQAAE
jgi:hypothetical protein